MNKLKKGFFSFLKGFKIGFFIVMGLVVLVYLSISIAFWKWSLDIELLKFFLRTATFFGVLSGITNYYLSKEDEK